jgi:tRNA (guanine10-N2)-methyltransferase
MLQYGKGSQYLDVIVADASLPLWRPSFRVDCIITDRKYSSQTGYNLYRSRTDYVKRGRMLTDVEVHATAETCSGRGARYS